MTSYFRVQSADRNTADLLDPEFHVSHYWGKDLTQPGVSACATRDDLARYLATAGQGIPIGDGVWVLVEMAGDELDTRAFDGEHGEVLIIPTAIIAASPLDDEFFDLINAYYEES